MCAYQAALLLPPAYLPANTGTAFYRLIWVFTLFYLRTRGAVLFCMLCFCHPPKQPCLPRGPALRLALSFRPARATMLFPTRFFETAFLARQSCLGFWAGPLCFQFFSFSLPKQPFLFSSTRFINLLYFQHTLPIIAIAAFQWSLCF